MNLQPGELGKLRDLLSWLRRSAPVSPVGMRILQSEAIGCRIYRSTTQSINASSLSAISYDTELIDTDDMWDAGDATKIYAQRSGYYRATASIQLDLTTGSWRTGRFFAAIRKNGVAYQGADEEYLNGQAYVFLNPTAGMIELGEGDYLQVIVYHDQAAAKTLSAADSVDQHQNCFSVERIA